MIKLQDWMFENMDLQDFVRMKMVIFAVAIIIIIIYLNYVFRCCTHPSNSPAGSQNGQRYTLSQEQVAVVTQCGRFLGLNV